MLIRRSVGLRIPCLLLALVAIPWQLLAHSRHASDLQFSLRTEKQTHRLGEQVLVTVAWKNVTGHRVRVREWLGWQSGAFAVYRGSQRLEYRCLSVDYVAGPPSHVLKPQQEYKETIDVAQCYDLQREGAYAVRAESLRAPKEHAAVTQNARVDVELVRVSEQELGQLRPLAAANDALAIRVLGAHRDTQAVPALEKAIEAPGEDVRGDAAVALARIGTAEAIGVLRAHVARETDFVLQTAIQEILRSPGVETPMLKELLVVPLYPPLNTEAGAKE